MEELEASLRAIAGSELNAFSFLDPDRAMTAARNADVSAPFGGLPVGVKELEPVAGWPATEASLVFRDRIAASTSPVIRRLRDAGGAVAVGLTTASEFGGLNVGVTKLNGVTHNPWRHGRTPGGSSAGSAAAVAGGLVTLATGGDGGGSIRIPAGYTGLLGMKGTYGRIPRGPDAWFRPGTVVLGCLARSVRDAARHYDVCAGYDPIDPASLPRQARLGGRSRHARARGPARRGDPRARGRGGRTGGGGAGARVGRCAHRGERHGRGRPAGRFAQPGRAVDGRQPLDAARRARRPLAGCAADLTDEIAIGLYLSQSVYNLRAAAVAEELRVRAYEEMAAAFEQVDFIVAATNPSPAFAAEAAMSSPSDSFVDWAKSNAIARLGFRGVLGARARRRRRLPERALADPRSDRRALPRPGADGRSHDDLESLRQSRGLDPRGLRRRAAGGHAGARPAPRRRAAVRRRARGRARVAVAARGRLRGKWVP